jgi:hypothetical protein
MLPARMSVNVVDEHPALRAQKKVDHVKWTLSRIVSCARGYMFFLQEAVAI